MSIATAILADNPILYWKLDDPTGPAASDSSGNGNAGFYTGTANLAQPGPEAGTTCVLLQAAGGILSVSASPRRIVPFSMDCWVAIEGPQGVGNVIIYNGKSSATGLGQAWGTSVPPTQAQKLLRGGIAFGGDAGALLQGTWHHIAFTLDGASNYAEYVDGVSLATAAGLPFNAIAASDIVVAGAAAFASQLAYMAHVALYPTALSAARIAAHFAAPAALQTPGIVGGPTATDIAAVNTQLATLNADCSALATSVAAILAAVRKTF